MKAYRLTLAVVLALAAPLAGCGSDDASEPASNADTGTQQ